MTDLKTRYQVYYMNNDGQKVIVERNLLYMTAVKKSQQLNTTSNFSYNYETQKTIAK